jgi:hypothetical protein
MMGTIMARFNVARKRSCEIESTIAFALTMAGARANRPPGSVLLFRRRDYGRAAPADAPHRQTG